MDQFSGIVYKLTASDNFEAYLKEIQVSTILRKTFLRLTPTFQIVVNGLQHKMIMSSLLMHVEIQFKIGEEFEYKAPDGHIFKILVTQPAPNKLIEIQRGSKSKISSKIIREFSKRSAKMTYIAGDIVATRIYTAQN